MLGLATPRLVREPGGGRERERERARAPESPAAEAAEAGARLKAALALFVGQLEDIDLLDGNDSSVRLGWRMGLSGRHGWGEQGTGSRNGNPGWAVAGRVQLGLHVQFVENEK